MSEADGYGPGGMYDDSHIATIGLDTSSYGFHWVGDNPNAVGWYKAPGDVNERWIHIYNKAFDFFHAIRPGTYVFCEEPLALKNGKTTRILGISAGIIHAAFIAACQDNDLTWFWVDVASWKRAVCKNGSANKDLVRERVREYASWQVDFGHPHESMFEDQRDLYDAWALMEYGRTEGVGA